MADVAQLVRALVCGTRCREFESLHPPHIKKARRTASFFYSKNCLYLVRCFNKICAGYTDWYNINLGTAMPFARIKNVL